MAKAIPGVKAKAVTNERKRQPGAYIVRGGTTLYRVIGPVGTGMLRVENASTGHEVNLRSIEVDVAVFVRDPAPVSCPDYLPADHFRNERTP